MTVINFETISNDLPKLAQAMRVPASGPNCYPYYAISIRAKDTEGLDQINDYLVSRWLNADPSDLPASQASNHMTFVNQSKNSRPSLEVQWSAKEKGIYPYYFLYSEGDNTYRCQAYASTSSYGQHCKASRCYSLDEIKRILEGQ